MLRLMYRLRRKRGAVLFIVIATMALLIAMATAAYYTARGSYNSVVSNYNYSQLYISAISAADMLKDAVMYSANTTASGGTSGTYTGSHPQAGTVADQFDKLQTKVAALKLKDQTVTASTANFTKTTPDDIAAELKETNNPAILGAVDGLQVVIRLADDAKANGLSVRVPALDDTINNVKGYKQLMRYCYEITTTAYYRGEYVQVQDYLTVDRWFDYTITETTAGEWDNKDAIIEPDKDTGEWVVKTFPPGGGNTAFNTFFTATGQQEGGDGKWDRTVTINAHEITDNSYFKSKYTYFKRDNADNKIGGSVTTLGSLYLEHKNGYGDNAKKAGHDWYIGENLYIMHDNSNGLELGQNNIYIDGDLVIACNKGITAKNIYVKGNVYALGNNSLNITDPENGNAKGQVYVGGKIFTKLEGSANPNILQTPPNSGIAAMSAPMSQGSYSSNSTINMNIGVENFEKIPNVDYYVRTVGTVTKDDGTEEEVFTSDKTKGTLKDAMDSSSKVLTDMSYQPITGYPETYGKLLTIDFNQIGSDPVSFNVKDVASNTNTALKANVVKNGGEIEITLPYSEVGYVLEVNNFNNANVTYKIQTGEKTMPIVLAPNTTVKEKDDAGNDTGDVYDAFSWRGDHGTNYANGNGEDNGNHALVAIQKNGADYGNVIFETANFTYRTDDDGNYLDKDGNKVTNANQAQKIYTPYKSGAVATQFVLGPCTVMGTQDQVDKVKYNNYDLRNGDGGMLKSGTSEPQEQYRDHIMLVSNVSGRTAIRADNQQGLICGYVYAPNGRFEGFPQNGGGPIFGGMIVSNYHAGLSKYIYAEPRPADIAALTQAMNGSIGSGGGNGSETREWIAKHIDGSETPGSSTYNPQPSSFSYSELTPSQNRDITLKDDWNELGANYMG